jgi:predicted nucleic acid-binding protein
MPHEIPSNLQFSLKKDNKDLLDEIFKRIEKLDITKIPSSSKGLTKEISTLQILTLKQYQSIYIAVL